MPSRLYPVICGPTASGKTDLAVALARATHAEIVTADAFQIYRGLDIGTAKPTLDQRAGIPHHLIDMVEPPERFTVADWLSHARDTITRLIAAGRLPVVVGGTHLYIKALTDGLFEGPAPDPALRRALLALPAHELRAELERVDPVAAARIHPADVRRTLRAVEVFRQTGSPISAWQAQWDSRAPAALSGHVTLAGVDWRPMLVVLDWPTDELNRRINARVRAMIDAGLLGEVRSLHDRGVLGPQASQGLGYKQLLDHLQGRCSLDDAVERLKIETRRFAKNQRTWLKRLRTTPGTLTLDAQATGLASQVRAILEAISTNSGTDPGGPTPGSAGARPASRSPISPA